MQRRNFLKTTATASALATLSPLTGFAQQPQKNFSEDEIKKIRARIKPVTAEEREQRIMQAQKLMFANNLDAIFLEGGTSLNYFTGAQWGRSERLFAMILPKTGEPSFVAPRFEETRALEQIGEAKLFTWFEDENPYDAVREIISQNNFLTGTLGIEETTRYFVTENIAKTVSTINIRSATPVTAGCRSIKSAHEIELMQIANDITAQVFKKAKTKLQAGMSENDFATIITKLFAEFGVEGGALVLFGKASAHPHGLREENRLKEGDIVLMDGGCSVEGYESDITRTTVFGTPTEKMKQVWQIVRNAQDAALKIARPGLEAGQVDAAARKIIGDSGYGNDYSYFTHRLGHGIGMDGHEWYYLVKKNNYWLQTGNMFSNEPGIYILGAFGIRLEDEMLITGNGAKLLLPQAQSLEKIF